MLSSKLLKELQQIIKEEYGVVLKLKNVSNMGNSIVSFFELLIEIDTETTIQGMDLHYEQQILQ